MDTAKLNIMLSTHNINLDLRLDMFRNFCACFLNKPCAPQPETEQNQFFKLLSHAFPFVVDAGETSSATHTHCTHIGLLPLDLVCLSHFSVALTMRAGATLL